MIAEKLGLDDNHQFVLSEPIDISDDIVQQVQTGKISSEAIGLYILCKEVEHLREEISKLKEELECRKNPGDTSSV